MFKNKLITVLLIFIFLFSTTSVFAKENSNLPENMREATPEEFEIMKKQLGDKAKRFKKAYIIDPNNNINITNNNINLIKENKNNIVINNLGDYVIRQVGVGDSIGRYHIASYYLDPHASFRQSVSHTKAHEISGNIAFDIKAIAAELGYGYTNSKTITREVSYTNGAGTVPRALGKLGRLLLLTRKPPLQRTW